MSEKYAGWPPVGLLDVDPADVRIDLRPVVTYIGDHLWLKGEQSPFPMPSRARQQIRTHSLTDPLRYRAFFGSTPPAWVQGDQEARTMASRAWTVTRKRDEVGIDVTAAASLEQGDTRAMVIALEDQLADDGVTSVRFGGSVLEARPLPERLTTLIRHLGSLVEARGLRFFIGPL